MCGVGMQVSVLPSVLLVLGIKPRWAALVAHAVATKCGNVGFLIPFCGLQLY